MGPGQDHRRRARPAAGPGVQRLSALRRLLDAVAAGDPPAPDGSLRVVPPSRDGEAALLGFVATHVVVADGVTAADLHGLPRAGDLSGPFTPPFLDALCALLGGLRVNAVDAVLVADPLDGPPALGLEEVDVRDHPRVQRAMRYRSDVRVWVRPGGLPCVGRGLGGRLEASFEVEPAARGAGLGRELATAARHLSGEPVWAQVAPANAASVRVVLAAGFRPVGAEALLLR